MKNFTKFINFKQLFSNEQNIDRLLRDIGLGKYKVRDIWKAYDRDPMRHVVIIQANDFSTGELQYIMIDSIYGNPDWMQIVGTTFDHYGMSCHKRILLCTKNNDVLHKGHEYDLEIASGFAHINNDCMKKEWNVETYIVEAIVDETKADDYTISYDVIVKPDGIKRTDHTKLPTFMEYAQALFGIYYAETDKWIDYHFESDCLNKPKYWIRNYYHINHGNFDAEFPVWNENGVFMILKSSNDEGAEYLRNVVGSNQELFKLVFHDSEIKVKENSNKSVTMYIKIWKEPLTYFINSDTEKKMKIAAMIRKSAYAIEQFWGEVVGGTLEDAIDLFGNPPVSADAYASFDTIE